MTGYDTIFGFVPVNLDNTLYQLIQNQISGGQSSLEEPLPEANVAEVNAIVLCAVFPRRWAHLVGPYERSFNYKSHPGAKEIPIDAKISNIPDDSTDVSIHLFEALKIKGFPYGGIGLGPLQTGMIAVEVPVTHLLKLFRNERTHLPESLRSYIETQLEIHHFRTGRDVSRGPRRDWLVEWSSFYLGRLLADLSTIAVRTFALEYGGAPPGHITEETLLRTNLSFARTMDGIIRIQAIRHTPEPSFGLSGPWPDGVATNRVSDPVSRSDTDLWQIASRTRELVAGGFALEALVFANSVYEVILERALVDTVQVEPNLRQILRRRGHAYCIDILKLICSAGVEPALSTTEFVDFVSAITETYEVRNSYVHQLEIPTDDPWKMVDLERRWQISTILCRRSLVTNDYNTSCWSAQICQTRNSSVDFGRGE